MHITSRPWVITTIAVVTILFSMDPLFGVLSTVLSSRGQALANPLFLFVLASSVVTTVSGVGLLMRKPWSRFGFALIAIFVSVKFLFWFPFATLYQVAIGNPAAQKVLHRVLPLTAVAVPFILTWVATLIVFRFFKDKQTLPNPSLQGTLRDEAAHRP